MNRSARDGQQLRSRGHGGRFLSASIIGLSALVVMGGVAYVQYERGDAPASARDPDSAQARLENPARAENPVAPRDLAQTEAARAAAEKRLADAMALQFTGLPRTTPAVVEKPVAVDKSQAPKAAQTETRVADLPAPSVPSPGVPLAGLPRSDPAQGVVARADTPALHSLAMSSDEQDALMGRVDGLLKQGDIGAARAVLQRLVRENNAKAAFVLGQSYDPVILKQAHVIGMRPDAELAHTLYSQALKGGIAQAEPALAALQTAKP
ncbi:MAG: hypothetical protein JWL62_3308 [Hyphomicrobiales bacterium]|nr:hypothetical protein [Hyphomicrobiales bacterium]